MIRFCPQCAHPILDVIEELPCDGANDAKTIATCHDCNLMVHVYHLQSAPSKHQDHGLFSTEDVIRAYSLQGDYEAQ